MPEGESRSKPSIIGGMSILEIAKVGVARGLCALGFLGPPACRSGPVRARFSGPPARPLNAVPRLLGC